ncbi:sulfite exporter TauE/SafE family protein [Tropicimonas marinistellae]|uniref:sulfite exporter TauE/SafE family protein n=1 Tax=Tropicimonas marinistellae TaxID=1739787 RepID=UPI0008338E9B|nr:sulfite exporter TauE/SafE family protein [Tropicimonas marinistellae]
MIAALSADGLTPAFLALALGITFVAGFVKGTTGFAMPMIMISGLASFLSPELALAGLILPTLVTNVMQALRDGIAAAWRAVRRFRIYFAVGGACILLAGQLVTALDPRIVYALIGIPITGFGLLQIVGWRPRIAPENQRVAEVGLGAASGIVGGISGVWGPPLVMYLTALGTPKAEQVRTQGVAFALAAVLLVATHLQSGVLNTRTLPFSGLMLVPALAGMWIGQRVQDGLDQEMFRKATLVVLMLAGLNLLRRAIM